MGTPTGAWKYALTVLFDRHVPQAHTGELFLAKADRRLIAKQQTESGLRSTWMIRSHLIRASFGHGRSDR